MSFLSHSVGIACMDVAIHVEMLIDILFGFKVSLSSITKLLKLDASEGFMLVLGVELDLDPF